jgi:hypothetical protein
MADNATLEFLGAQMERMLADQAEMRDDIRVLTAIVLRHENTLNAMREKMRDMLRQMTAMVAQYQRFSDRLRRLEEQSAE